MKSKKRIRALCVIAACFAVVILAAVVIVPLMFDNDEPLPPVRDDGTNSQAPSENVIPPSTGPSSEYDEMVFPDYAANNPVRYLDESMMGKCNGWQNLGLNGEIRTIPVPIRSTYVYQMYAYFIRNDLRHMYPAEVLPDELEKLPAWLSDTMSPGRGNFWYSMGQRSPAKITLEAITTIASDNGAMQFIKAEYKVHLHDSSREKEEHWVIYFMEEDGVYSAYAVIANENFDFVKSYSESIVKTYQTKHQAS